MSAMFSGATAFNGDISYKAADPKDSTSTPSWDISKVTTMESMFSGAAAFNGDISKWDTSNVTTMENVQWSYRI